MPAAMKMVEEVEEPEIPTAESIEGEGKISVEEVVKVVELPPFVAAHITSFLICGADVSRCTVFIAALIRPMSFFLPIDPQISDRKST